LNYNLNRDYDAITGRDLARHATISRPPLKACSTFLDRFRCNQLDHFMIFIDGMIAS
jgi:hypothetical protein